MPVQLNHTIVAARDKHVSARFLTDLLGLPDPIDFPPFVAVTLDNGVALDYADTPVDFPPQHYAFLVSDDVFDHAIARIRSQGIEHWADPHGAHPGEINTHDGGRGVYFCDPAGHYLELITRPYGGGPALPVTDAR